MKSTTQGFNPEGEKSARRAKWRRITAVICLCAYALAGWLRLRETLVYWAYLLDLKIWPSPLYILLSGAGIGLSFSLGALFAALRLRFAPLYTRISGILFLLWLWCDHIFLGTREAFFDQVFMLTIISLLTLLVVFILVRNKDFSKEENHGRE